MKIVLTKLSEASHRVEVLRLDGSTDAAVLDSRSFLRHDFAHFAVEAELPIRQGYWGQVAGGMPLGGAGFAGQDLALAERLSGPVQTLMRLEAGPEHYLVLLQALLGDQAGEELAQRIHDRARRLAGHWRATPFGDAMHITWDES
jgi:hypothetical protein